MVAMARMVCRLVRGLRSMICCVVEYCGGCGWNVDGLYDSSCGDVPAVPGIVY